MEYGSLYDLLRNETMYAGGEIILQIVRDIAQGIRYLHESKPPITHGDLKVSTIFVPFSDLGGQRISATLVGLRRQRISW